LSKYTIKGNCCEDIARLLMLCVDANIRRENTDRILQFYHQKLITAIKSINTKSIALFSIDQIYQSYKAILPVTMMVMRNI
jgi:hypothetical protein